MKTKEYKHFLTYEQLCFDEAEYGYTDLLFDINGSKLFIKKVDHRNLSTKELEFPIINKNVSTEIILENFLIDLMSYRYNFSGRPVLIKSEIFSEKWFNVLLEKGSKIQDERNEIAILENSNVEIIKFCESVGLNPRPEGSSPTNWYANCPSGGAHPIMISTISQEWGCGYCKKKGDLIALKDWLNTKRKSS